MYGFNEGLFDDIVDIDVPDTAVVIDIDDTVDEGPEVGVATGIADMVLRLINAENDTITDYNSARTTLAQDPTYAEFIEVIDDIEAEELKHVGQLQTLLKRLSPNASNIEAGEEEAEGQLTEDLDNMERVTKGKNIDVHGEIPIVMADAVMASEEADKAVEDELEEHNKKTNVKLNKVLGAEKQPVPKLPEMAKVTLDESLFEDYGNVREYSDMLFDMIEEGMVDAEEIAKDLIYWCSEDDIKRFMELRNLIWDEDEDDEDFDESLNEGRKPIDFVDSHGDIYSDEDRWDEEEPEDDLFSKVMLELCPEGADWKKHSKFPEITGKDRYDTDELGVTYNGDIEVAVDDMNRLAFATRVGEAYDLPIRGPEKTRSGKFILTLKIEE